MRLGWWASKARSGCRLANGARSSSQRGRRATRRMRVRRVCEKGCAETHANARGSMPDTGDVAMSKRDYYSELADALGCDPMDSHGGRLAQARRSAMALKTLHELRD